MKIRFISNILKEKLLWNIVHQPILYLLSMKYIMWSELYHLVTFLLHIINAIHQKVWEQLRILPIQCSWYPGYLPVEEVIQLSFAYSTVYNLGLDRGTITAAVNMAKSVDIRHGLVNIEMFIHCIMHNCYKWILKCQNLVLVFPNLCPSSCVFAFFCKEKPKFCDSL